MKSQFLRQTVVFGVAVAVTAAGWAVFWPVPKPREPQLVELSPPPPGRLHWTGRDLTERIEALEVAATGAERLKAALRLNEIPPSEIPKALEQLKLVENRQLTLAAQLLLIRWSASDGEAAANWAWTRFRPEGLWNQVFREISASWAWSHPATLAEWALNAAKRRKPSDDISLAEATATDSPLLDSDLLNRVSLDLIRTEPRLAVQVFLARGGWRSDDHLFFDSMGTVQQLREALLAFDNLDQLQPDRSQGFSQIFAKSLLHRWKEIDPEDFARSPYAHLIPDRTSPVPPAPIPDGPCGWVSEFEAWKKSSPGARPDMTGWPAAKQQAWEDLEALMPGGGH